MHPALQRFNETLYTFEPIRRRATQHSVSALAVFACGVAGVVVVLLIFYGVQAKLLTDLIGLLPIPAAVDAMYVSFP